MSPESVHAVDAHTHGRSVGIISAFRTDLDPDRNVARDAQLRADARKHGLGIIRLHGRYRLNDASTVDDWAVVVCGKEGDDNGLVKGFLLKHGQTYEQRAVAYKPHGQDEVHLLGTSPDSFLQFRELVPWGPWKPTRIPELHTTLRDADSCPRITFESYRFVLEKSFSNRRDSDYV